MTVTALDVAACRRRQARLLELMNQRETDLVVLGRHEHVQWLTGVYFDWFYQPLAAIARDGRVVLVAPNAAPEPSAADTVVTYEAQRMATLRNDQRQAAAEKLVPALRRTRWQRVGFEFSALPGHLLQLATDPVDVEPDLLRLRRRKEPDELELIGRAIAATEAMYACARRIIRPGISELEVFSRLQQAAVDVLGERLTGTGNDYQCASAGGPPRAGRPVEAGELYILDLGPAFRGYFADNCRTVAVSEPTELQRQAWAHVVRVLDYVEEAARPGARCRDLYEGAAAMLGQAPVGDFPHHLGHGIGLFPHEPPHLNPNWDETLELGDVFTVEPGLYDERLRAGIRIEDNYRVTETGLQRLSNFNREL